MTFKPITLRKSVATLADFPNHEKRWWKREANYPPLSDSDELRHLAGIHRECGEVMYFSRPLGVYGLLACVRCELRIVIPKGVTTYGELRCHAAATEPPPPANPTNICRVLFLWIVPKGREPLTWVVYNENKWRKRSTTYSRGPGHSSGNTDTSSLHFSGSP